MQAATDITIAAYRETAPQIARGMTPADIGKIMSAAMTKRGATPEFTLILLGEASAYPHGSSKPQEVRSGEVVLMDCGCTVEGYQSDISRTMVMGEPTKKSAAASRSHSTLRRWERRRVPSMTPFARRTRKRVTDRATNCPEPRIVPGTASASMATSR
jgi:methionine aminopeptidase